MSKELEEIEAKVRSLRPEERHELLRSLIAELDGPPDAEAEQAWLKAARSRRKELMEGKVKGVPADQVFKKVRAQRKR